MLESGKENVPPLQKQCRNPCLWSFVYTIPVRARTPMPSTAGKLSWPCQGMDSKYGSSDLWQLPSGAWKSTPRPLHAAQHSRERRKRCCSVDLKGDRELFPRNPHKFEINTPLQPIRGSQHSHLQAHTHRANPHVLQPLPPFSERFPALG